MSSGKGNHNNGGLLRKVQKLGASSLIVTLPRDWARRHNVNVGDTIKIYDEGDKLVIAPSNYSAIDRIHVNLSKSSCARHVGRLILCSYVFGYDEMIGESNRIIKGQMLERIARTSTYLHGADLRLTGNNKVIEVSFGDDSLDPRDAISLYGKELSSLLSVLARKLKGYEVEYEGLQDRIRKLAKTNYRMLRVLNKGRAFNSREEKRLKQLLSIGVLLGMAGDTVSKLAELIHLLEPGLKDDEKERLSFILEVAEVATGTLALSINPPSVKKAEDAYWKIKSILDLEEHASELIESATPQYAYLLSHVIDLARLLEVAENVILCMALEEKHANT